MKKSRFSEDQIIAALKEHQAGIPVADICRKHGINDATSALATAVWRCPTRAG